MPDKRIADIQVVRNEMQHVIKVTVPKGTTLDETLKLRPALSELIGKLKGCPACNSGIPIWIHEREEIEDLVRIDLDRMQRI
jgi:hypothetical protein